MEFHLLCGAKSIYEIEYAMLLVMGKKNFLFTYVSLQYFQNPKTALCTGHTLKKTQPTRQLSAVTHSTAQLHR